MVRFLLSGAPSAAHDACAGMHGRAPDSGDKRGKGFRLRSSHAQFALAIGVVECARSGFDAGTVHVAPRIRPIAIRSPL